MRRSKLTLLLLGVLLVSLVAAAAEEEEDKEVKEPEKEKAAEGEKEKEKEKEEGTGGSGSGGGKPAAAKFSYRADSAWLDLTYKVPMNITFYEVVESGSDSKDKSKEDDAPAAEERGETRDLK